VNAPTSPADQRALFLWNRWTSRKNRSNCSLTARAMNSAPLRKMMSEQAVARESIHDSQKARTEMTGGKSFAP
jgi:hypothetical protein